MEEQHLNLLENDIEEEIYFEVDLPSDYSEDLYDSILTVTNI